jgi:RHS repeat-associated protein
VTHVGGTTAGYQKYWYDANGNATRRISGSQDIPLTYDAENRLTAMSGGVTASYVYDADGKRVKETAGGATTVYIGNAFEWTGSTATMKSYYYAGALRVAMRTGVSPGTVNYLLSDHLGSQALTLTSAGARLNTNTELRYYPWGGGRYVAGATPTSYNFTGQRKDSGSGLLFYNARWYDPTVGRFAQADTIVPQPGNPQSLNRYSYCGSNPLKYVDGSGHNAIEFWGGAGGGGGGLAFLAAMAGLAQNVSQQAQNLTVQMAPTVSEMGQVWYVHGNQIIAAADQVSQAAQNAGQAGNTTGSGGLDPKDPRFKELLDQAVHQGADATCPGCKTTNPELLRGKGAIAAKQHVMNPADIGKDGISAWCQGCRSNLPPKFWDHSIGEIQRFAEQIGLDPTKAAVYTPQYGGAGHYSLFIDAIGADGYILPRYAELIDAFLRSMR